MLSTHTDEPLSGLQKGAYSWSRLLQTWYDPPPVAGAVSVGLESLVLAVVAVILSGTAPMVVGIPLIVVKTGVIVETGVPEASTETHGAKGEAVTKVIRTMLTSQMQIERFGDTYQLSGKQGQQQLPC